MDFVYINKTSLSREICEDIIHYYNKDYTKGYKGSTFSGINDNIKDTWDLNIGAINTEYWKKIHKLLSDELELNLLKYINDLNIENVKNHNPSISDFKLLTNVKLKQECFQIQKYDKNKGKYIYHIDDSVDYEKKRYRVITYLWYLNDVPEGGETEFFSKVKIKPECGKLILFPATWSYPHCSKIPISNDKYIITGWMYLYE